MLDYYNLNEKTFFQYALHNYENPSCMTLEEFKEDLKILKYLKRLLTQYTERDMLNENLVLNHIITLFNVFGIIATPKILFYSVPSHHWSQICTVMMFLNKLPKNIYGINGKSISTDQIPIDENLLKKLRKIY